MRRKRLPLMCLFAGLAALGCILAALVLGAGASASSLPWPPPPIKPPAASIPFRETPPQAPQLPKAPSPLRQLPAMPRIFPSGIMRTGHTEPASQPNPKMVPVRDLPDPEHAGLEDVEAVIPAQGLEKIEIQGPDLTGPAAAPLPPGPPLPLLPPEVPQAPDMAPTIDPTIVPKFDPIIDPKIAPKIQPKIGQQADPKVDSPLNLPVQPRDGFVIETDPAEPVTQPLAKPFKTEVESPKLIRIQEPDKTTESAKIIEPSRPVEVNLLPAPAKAAPPKTEPIKTEPIKTEPAKTDPLKMEPANRGPEVMLYPELSKTPTPLKLQTPARKQEIDSTPLFNPPSAAPLLKPSQDPSAVPLPKGVPLSTSPVPQPFSQLATQPALPIAPLRTAVPIRRAPRPEPTHESISRSPSPKEARSAETRTAVADGAIPKSPGPLLAVEKRGPTSVAMGQPLRYEIIVQNLGSEVAPQVRVEDDLSEGLRYLDGSPQPVLQDGKVVWSIDQLAPGAKQHLYLDAQAAANGEVICHTTVSLYGGLTTTIAPPVLELDVVSPGRVATGKKAVFDIRMKNVTNLRLKDLTLQAVVPPGLQHPQGKTIEADIGDLAPGASRNIQLPLEAVQNGRHVLEVRVRSGDSQEALAQGSVLVGETGLSLQLGSANQPALDRECDVLIELANANPQAVRNIAITDTLPEGLEYVAASDRGMYRSVTRSVHWVLDYLPPGQSRTLRLRVRPRTAAAHVHQVVAESQDGQKAQAEGAINVQGQARLSMRITDRDDPLRIGRETVYEIRVLNEGTSADGGVELRATFAEGLLPRSAQAPVQHRIEGQTIVFEPLARLDGQKQAIYRVAVQARSPGDQRMSATVSSRQLTSPLVREERTWVFRE